MEWIGKIGAGIVLVFTSITGGIFGFFNTPNNQISPKSLSNTSVEAVATSSATIATTSDSKPAEWTYKIVWHSINTPFIEIKDKKTISYQALGQDVFFVQGGRSTKLEGADYKTFEVAYRAGNPNKHEWGATYAYGRDKSHVWYADRMIDGADPGSFALIPGTGQNFSSNGAPIYSAFNKDAFHVYANGELVSGADPATFVVYGRGNQFGHDSKSVYHANGKVEGADLATFQLIPGSETSQYGWVQGYAKDKNNVYSGNSIIAFADPRTFTLVEGTKGVDSKDAKHYFWDGRLVSNSSDLMTILDKNGKKTGYTKDSITVYLYDQPLEVDPATFQPLFLSDGSVSWYAKDASQVYIKTLPPGVTSGYPTLLVVKGADSATFTLDVPNIKTNVASFARDKNHVYSSLGVAISDSPSTFREIEFPYYADAQHVYYNGPMKGKSGPLPIIDGADPNTFTASIPTVIRDLTNQFAKDKDHVFMSGILLDGINPISFKEIYYPYYYQDAANIYYLAWDAYPIVIKMEKTSAASETSALTTIATEPDRFLRAGDRIYADGVLIAGADASSFKEVDAPYYKDNMNVYYDTTYDGGGFNVVVGADPASFELKYISADCSFFRCTEDAKDKNHTFYKGKMLK